MSLRSRPTTSSSNDQTSTSSDTTATTGLDVNGCDDQSNQSKKGLVVVKKQVSFSHRALVNSGNLAKLLPSGTLLAFQLLTPIFTNKGSCDPTRQTLTLVLQIILAVSCFLASFTDSLKAPDGQVYYGFVTRTGLWLFDSPSALASGVSRPDLSVYRLRFIDWIHAVMSVLVYGAVALKDRNVVSCFYPEPEQGILEVLDVVPIGIGIACSMLFMAFPTTRHGIGYPM